ncbi:hypothetical protein ACJMK2_042278 [Sinanodonta woodiana]|uniref:EF-hand domain-containing protein n=1 Tax=Sinanodonta woodiana TaxID=1069815 RepID=A0ABD3W7I2_SINWO
MKTVYQNTKKNLKGDYSQHYDLPVRDQVGAYVTVEQDKLERWKKHFECIMNRPDPPVIADIPEAVDDLDVNCDGITVEEVKQVIYKLKNVKAPGNDGVCPKMLKAEDTETPKLLRQILQKICNSEKAPKDWNTGVIVKLSKKGDLGNCNN